MCRALLLYDSMNSVRRVSIVTVLINRCDELHNAEYDKYGVQSMAKPDRFTLQYDPDIKEYVRWLRTFRGQPNYGLGRLIRRISPFILHNDPTLSPSRNTDMCRLLNPHQRGASHHFSVSRGGLYGISLCFQASKELSSFGTCSLAKQTELPLSVSDTVSPVASSPFN